MRPTSFYIVRLSPNIKRGDLVTFLSPDQRVKYHTQLTRYILDHEAIVPVTNTLSKIAQKTGGVQRKTAESRRVFITGCIASVFIREGLMSNLLSSAQRIEHILLGTLSYTA